MACPEVQPSAYLVPNPIKIPAIRSIKKPLKVNKLSRLKISEGTKVDPISLKPNSSKSLIVCKLISTEVPFDKYSIALFHPPFFKDKKTFFKEALIFVKSLILSRKNYLVIYPNNDFGNDVIINIYNKLLKKNKNFRIIKSFRFEFF